MPGGGGVDGVPGGEGEGADRSVEGVVDLFPLIFQNSAAGILLGVMTAAFFFFFFFFFSLLCESISSSESSPPVEYASSGIPPDLTFCLYLDMVSDFVLASPVTSSSSSLLSSDAEIGSERGGGWSASRSTDLFRQVRQNQVRSPSYFRTLTRAHLPCHHPPHLSHLIHFPPASVPQP